MMRHKLLTITLLLSVFLLSGCGKTQKMHQQAYDYSELSNYGEALGLYEKLLEKKPDKPIFLNDYGWVLFMSDSLQKAESVLKEAKKKGRESGKLLRLNIEKNLKIVRSFIQIKDHLEKQQPQQALEILKQLNKSWKTREMRLKYLALTHEQLGNPEKANTYWQQIIDQYANADFKTPYEQLAEKKLKTN